ncbi:MAG TPA: APC family permease [Gemmatimonadales bacterium]|jgi:amino acid transporter|nr:APC family permease [Gemmatimonadales bacterium]
MTDQSDEGLLRVIGPAALAGSLINSVIGGGIFAIPAALALTVGSAGPLAVLLAAVVMGFAVAAMAQAGQRVARSGGIYAYAEVAFGPLAGYLTGVLLALTCVLAAAGVAAALVDSLSTLSPLLGGRLFRAAAIVLLFAALVAVNLPGVRSGTRVAAGAAVVKFLALLLFVALGATLVRPEHLAIPQMPAASSLARGAILAVFALAGMEIALGASGEVRDPARTIPRALLAAFSLIVLLYLAIQLVAQGVLGPELAASRAPLADALARISPSGRYFMLAAGAVSMLGWLAGDVLGSSRMFFAFGRMGVLPRPLGEVHPRTRVPHYALVAYGVIAALLALTGTFASLVFLASVSNMLLYVACCAAAWELERRARARGDTALPGRSGVIPLLAVLGLLGVLSSSTARELLAVAGVLILATILYWTTGSGRRAAARRGSAVPVGAVTGRVATGGP